MIDPDTMDEEQLDVFLKKRGFEDDEIKGNFPTLDKKREAVRETLQLQTTKTATEEEIGWDEDDKSELSTSQKAIVKTRRDERDKLKTKLKETEDKLKKAEAEVVKEADKELTESIKETKAPVSKSDVKSAMADIKALMAEDAEDDEDEAD